MIKAVIFDCFGVLSHAGESNDALFDYIAELRIAGIAIGLLSNANDNMLAELFLPEQVSMFDEVVLSYQTGMAKPDHGIYQLTATRLGMLPEECLFVDDIERFCTAAQEIGMQAVLFTDTSTVIARIEEFLNA